MNVLKENIITSIRVSVVEQSAVKRLLSSHQIYMTWREWCSMTPGVECLCLSTGTSFVCSSRVKHFLVEAPLCVTANASFYAIHQRRTKEKGIHTPPWRSALETSQRSFLGSRKAYSAVHRSCTWSNIEESQFLSHSHILLILLPSSNRWV